jgi:hypothetical protein
MKMAEENNGVSNSAISEKHRSENQRGMAQCVGNIVSAAVAISWRESGKYES